MEGVETIVRSALPAAKSQVTYADVLTTCQITPGIDYRDLPNVIRALIGNGFLHRELRRTEHGVTLFLVRN